MKNRQNTKAKGSVSANPILMIGKEVPHNMPASKVKNTALALTLNCGFCRCFPSFAFPMQLANKAFLES